MALQGLGYAGFGSDNLEDWRQFGTGLVGRPRGRPRDAHARRSVRTADAGAGDRGNYRLMSGTCAWWDGVSEGNE
jgi:hypothetical protein